MNVYISNELTAKLIRAEIADIPFFIQEAIEEKLKKEEAEAQ